MLRSCGLSFVQKFHLFFPFFFFILSGYSFRDLPDRDNTFSTNERFHSTIRSGHFTGIFFVQLSFILSRRRGFFHRDRYFYLYFTSSGINRRTNTNYTSTTTVAKRFHNHSHITIRHRLRYSSVTTNQIIRFSLLINIFRNTMVIQIAKIIGGSVTM